MKILFNKAYFNIKSTTSKLIKTKNIYKKINISYTSILKTSIQQEEYNISQKIGAYPSTLQNKIQEKQAESSYIFKEIEELVTEILSESSKVEAIQLSIDKLNDILTYLISTYLKNLLIINEYEVFNHKVSIYFLSIFSNITTLKSKLFPDIYYNLILNICNLIRSTSIKPLLYLKELEKGVMKIDLNPSLFINILSVFLSFDYKLEDKKLSHHISIYVIVNLYNIDYNNIGEYIFVLSNFSNIYMSVYKSIEVCYLLKIGQLYNSFSIFRILFGFYLVAYKQNKYNHEKIENSEFSSLFEKIESTINLNKEFIVFQNNFEIIKTLLLKLNKESSLKTDFTLNSKLNEDLQITSHFQISNSLISFLLNRDDLNINFSSFLNLILVFHKNNKENNNFNINQFLSKNHLNPIYSTFYFLRILKISKLDFMFFELSRLEVKNTMIIFNILSKSLNLFELLFIFEEMYVYSLSKSESFRKLIVKHVHSHCLSYFNREDLRIDNNKFENQLSYQSVSFLVYYYLSCVEKFPIIEKINVASEYYSLLESISNLLFIKNILPKIKTSFEEVRKTLQMVAAVIVNVKKFEIEKKLCNKQTYKNRFEEFLFYIFFEYVKVLSSLDRKLLFDDEIRLLDYVIWLVNDKRSEFQNEFLGNDEKSMLFKQEFDDFVDYNNINDEILMKILDK